MIIKIHDQTRKKDIEIETKTNNKVISSNTLK